MVNDVSGIEIAVIFQSIKIAGFDWSAILILVQSVQATSEGVSIFIVTGIDHVVKVIGGVFIVALYDNPVAQVAPVAQIVPLQISPDRREVVSIHALYVWLLSSSIQNCRFTPHHGHHHTGPIVFITTHDQFIHVAPVAPVIHCIPSQTFKGKDISHASLTQLLFISV